MAHTTDATNTSYTPRQPGQPGVAAPSERERSQAYQRRIDAARALARECGWAPLEGSAAQVAWAEVIRHAALVEIKEAHLAAVLAAETSARHWIDWKGLAVLQLRDVAAQRLLEQARSTEARLVQCERERLEAQRSSNAHEQVLLGLAYEAAALAASYPDSPGMPAAPALGRLVLRHTLSDGRTLRVYIPDEPALVRCVFAGSGGSLVHKLLAEGQLRAKLQAFALGAKG